MDRPSSISFSVIPCRPKRSARTLRWGLHPRHPACPRQDRALRGPSLCALHPQHPQPCAPWPLQLVGHFHLPGHGPSPDGVADCDFDLTPFAMVTHTPFPFTLAGSERQPPSTLRVHPRFQGALAVVHGQPHLKWHTPFPGAASHAAQRGEVRSLGLVKRPTAPACRLKQPRVAPSPSD